MLARPGRLSEEPGTGGQQLFSLGYPQVETMAGAVRPWGGVLLGSQPLNFMGPENEETDTMKGHLRDSPVLCVAWGLTLNLYLA